MVKLSYTNARGEVVILDDTERTFLGELYGREGTEAPELEYKEVIYGDGSTEILAINLKPRDVTFYFWAPIGTPWLREKLEDIKEKLIQTGSREGDWGQLMIRRKDGRPLYLNCAYTGGIEDLVRSNKVSVSFSLTFHAQDALFYDGFEQTFTMKQDDRAGYLYMAPDLYMSSSLYMRSAQSRTGTTIEVNGDIIYPKIVITGPAENISITSAATGRKIKLSADVTLGLGEKIVVTTGQRKRMITKTSRSGVVTNLFGKLSSDSSLNWWLRRGANEIVYVNTATTPESALQFVYKEGYLSAE